jgi:hypothetical protein
MFETIIIIVTALVFGPIFIGIALGGIWSLIVLVFPYVFWTAVAVGCVVGMWVFGRRLSDTLAKERAQKEAGEEKLRIAREQREELEALHSQVRHAYHDLFDAERRRSQQAIGP